MKGKRKVNRDLFDYIDSNLIGVDNELQLCIYIYVLLANVLTYSPKFACDGSWRGFKRIDNVNLDNNSIICSQWARIYSDLLKKYGVDSKIVVDDQGHYYVSFIIDNVVYNVDASKYGGDFFNYRLSDFSNVQFGLDLCGWSILITDYSVSYQELVMRSDFLRDQLNIVCDRLYKKRISNERIQLFRDYFTNKFKCFSFRDMNFECIIERMPYLNYFARMNFVGGTIEKHQLLKKIMGILFDNMVDMNMFVIPIYDKYNDYNVYSILCFGYKDEYIYYLQDDDGFEFVLKENLLDKVSSRGCVFGKYKHLPGFYLTTSDSFMLKKTP